MSTVAEDVQQIRSAIYGRDVREAIADGIEHCYSDVSSGVTTANTAANTANAAAQRANTAAAGAEGIPGTASLEDVNNLKSALINEPVIPIVWEQGRLSVSGTPVDSDYAIRSMDFIHADSNHRTLWLLAGEYPLPEGATNLRIVIYEYSSTSPETLVKYTDKSMAGKSQTLTFDSTTVAFKAAIIYTPAATYVINPNVGNLISVMWNFDALPRIVYNTNKTANDAYDGLVYGSPSYLDWEQGRLSLQGAEVDSTTLCRTKLVPVSAGNVLEIVQAPKHGVDIFYYNGSTFVERIPVGGGSQAKLGTRFYTVPTGVNGVRLTSGIDGTTPITPDVAEKMVFMAISDRAFLEILHGAENGVHRAAKMKSFGNSIMTGTIYPNGSIGSIVAFDNAPYGGIAVGLGVQQKNVDHTLISSTGLLYDAGRGSFLDNIKQTNISDIDYLLTHLWTDDMSNFPLGNVNTSKADDGTIIGGVLSLLSYVRTNNALCNVVLVSVPPVKITNAGDGIFDAVYANGYSIKNLDAALHELADRYHFTYVDWQDMYLSYHYQDYTYQSNNVHLASDVPYRTMREYLQKKVCDSPVSFNPIYNKLGVYDIEWEMGRYSASGADVTSDTYIRSKTDQPIAVTPGDTIFLGGVNNNAVFSAYYYNSANIFVSYVANRYYMNVITIPDGVSFVKITARKTTTETITTDYGKNIIVLRFDGDIAKAAAAFGEKAPRLCQAMCTEIAASTDYDTLTQYGNYISPSTIADRKTLVNAPTVENHVLYVFNFFVNCVIQIAMVNSTIPSIYYRIRRNAGGLFSAWYKVADSADITNIYNKLGVYNIEWEMGRYSITGADVTSDTYIRSKTDQPIAVTPGDTIIPYMDSNSSLAVYFYKKTGSAITFNSYISETNGAFTIPSDVNLMKVTFRKNPAETITTDYGKRLALYNANGVLMRPIFQKSDEPMLTIIDDDSNERFYNDLYGVFASKNVPIASAVITGRVGASGYMTWAEITECYENGIEILSHSNRHFLSTDPDFESLTENEIAKDYLIAKHKLDTHGIYDDLLVFSGSTGLYAKFNTAARRVYKGAFLAGDNRTNHQFSDKYKIYRYRVGNQTDYHCDLDVLKGLIDSVKSTGGWMIWMTHTSGGANAWTPGTGEGSSAYILGQAADYAVEQGVQIVTAEYGFRKYYSDK